MRKTNAQIQSTVAALSPKEIARMRLRAGLTVSKALSHAEEVLNGTRIWTPTQAQVFKILIGKVLPDISATFVEVHDTSTRRMSGLTREELEVIAAQGAKDVTLSEDHQNPLVPMDYPGFDLEHSPRAGGTGAPKRLYTRHRGAGAPTPADEILDVVTSPDPSGIPSTGESVSPKRDT